jgi:CDGSH-type Zn-finger protein
VVDTVEVPTDLDGKPQAAYCRCWRSAKFPLCDVSAAAHRRAEACGLPRAGSVTAR